MRKIGILNSEIVKEISAIGHTQFLIIGDAGLPIPKGIKDLISKLNQLLLYL